jgi:16S rRNA processing protein RimM
MVKSQCFELGYIAKIHGLDGGVMAVLDVDQPERYRKLDALFIEQENQLVPYLVNKTSGQKGNQLILGLEGIDNGDKASTLKGCKLWLPEKALPKLEKDQYYFHELVGCIVEDKALGRLGEIREILDLPQQTLASMDWKGAEVLIPLHENILLKFDRQASVLYTMLPDGLLEVYTKTETEEDDAH